MKASSNNENPVIKNALLDTDAAYETAGIDILREALSRTYKEHFLFATRLYKIQQTINKAKITHKPYVNH